MGVNDLKQELDNVGASLIDTSSDWRKRVDAIKRVKELLLAGAANNAYFVIFAKENLREAFNVQLKDLRSAVIREVCGCIQALCANCQASQWEVMSGWWLTALFKCSVVTIAAVAEASITTLRFVVQNGRLSPRAAACIFQHTQSKHSGCRTHAYECVLLILQVHPDPFLEKHADTVEESLLSGVFDGISEVRQLSRLTWWEYKAHFPERADSLYIGLDAQVQRNIQDEAEAFQALERPDPLPTTVANKAATPTMRRSSAGLLEGRKPDVIPAEEAPSSPNMLKEASRKRKPPPAARKRAASHDATLRAAVGQFGSNNDTPPSISHGSCLASDSSPASPTSTQNADADSTPLQPTVLDLDGPVKEAEEEADLGEECTTGPRQVESADRSPSISPKSGRAPGTRESSPFPWASSASAIPEDLPSILALADDVLWSNRVKFFDTISSLLRGTRQLDVALHLEKVMASFLERMKDPHYKVVLAAMQSLMDIFQLYAHQLEPYYEPVFARLFIRQVDTKEPVRKLAQEASELIGRVVQPVSTLVPSLLKVLDTNNPKVKCVCAAFLKGLLERCEEYLSHPPTMKMVAHKFLLTALQASRTLELERTCTAALLILHRLNAPVFGAQMSAMTPSEVLEARERLSPFIPGFAEDLAKHRKRAAAAHQAVTTHESPVALPPSTIEAEATAKAGRVAPDQKASPARSAASDKPSPSHSPNTNSTSPPVQPEISREADPEPSAPVPAALRARLGRTFSPVALDLDSPAPEPSPFVPAPTTTAARPTAVPEPPDDASGPISPASLHSLGKGPRSTWGDALPTVKAYDPTVYRTVRCPGSIYAPADRLASSPSPDGGSGSSLSLSSIVEELHTAKTQEQRREALQVLMVFAGPEGSAGASQWERNFPDVLAPTLLCATEDDFTLQLTALLVLRQLTVTHAALCRAHLPAIFRTVLQLANSPMPQLSTAAEEALAELVTAVGAPDAAAVIMEALNAKPLKLEVPLRLLGQVLSRLTPVEVLRFAPSFMGALYEGLKHRRAEVRKAVVFCLVDAHLAVGAPFEEWLEPLNASQQKLVALYVSRQQRLRNETSVATRQP